MYALFTRGLQPSMDNVWHIDRYRWIIYGSSIDIYRSFMADLKNFPCGFRGCLRQFFFPQTSVTVLCVKLQHEQPKNS